MFSTDGNLSIERSTSSNLRYIIRQYTIVNCLARVAPCCPEMFRRVIAIDLERSLVVSVDISGSMKDAVVC